MISENLTESKVDILSSPYYPMLSHQSKSVALAGLFMVRSNHTLDGFLTLITKKGANLITHSLNVMMLSLFITQDKKLTYDDSFLEELAIGALFHDLGKVYIPIEILNKPSSLLPDEMSMIREHPKIGYILMEPCGLSKISLDMILYHHLSVGYPSVKIKNTLLKNDHLKIITLADAFDAMTSDRPYQLKRTISEAFEEIKRNIGNQFDKTLSLSFINNMNLARQTMTEKEEMR